MNNEDKTKICPYCGEIIKVNARKCRFCGEWFENRQTEELGKVNNENFNEEKQNLGIFKNNQANQMPLEFKDTLFGIIGIIVIGLIFYYVFSNPLDELTRGCSKDGNIFDGETFYCKDKPWGKVEKTLSDTPPYYDYEVYVKNDLSNRAGRIYWQEGGYKCHIYDYTYDKYNKWNWLKTKYKNICTETEFIKKLKETIKEAEYKKQQNKKNNAPDIITIPAGAPIIY